MTIGESSEKWTSGEMWEGGRRREEGERIGVLVKCKEIEMAIV